MTKRMLINVVDPEESRIAILENDRLEELYVERVSRESTLGNVYKGRIVNIEPSIQAVFVDFGWTQNGFLHTSDISSDYKDKAPKSNRRPKKEDAADTASNDAGKGRSHSRQRSRKDEPLVQEVFKRGDEVIVQVIKDSVGNKGPTLTTYLSIPGRFCVLMPSIKRLGVSRKIEDEKERRRLRELLTSLDAPKELGIIVRTAGVDRTKQDLGRDLKYLVRLWDTLQKRTKSTTTPAVLYQESDLVIRTIRDYYTTDIDEIIIDSEPVVRKVLDFMKAIMPRVRSKALYYKGARPLFHKFGIESDIEAMNQREIPLKSGGSIVIDQTEALVAIDVNSGRSQEKTDPERTSLMTNLEAAREIGRQLRLRDMGGVIVNDFIDMRLEKNQRAVERELREELKKDKARTRVLRISKFGILEMTRQRIRPTKRSSSHENCPVCAGTGLVKSPSSMGLEVIRLIREGLAANNVQRVEAKLSPVMCTHIQNARRADLAQLELDNGKPITLMPEPLFTVEQTEILFYNKDGKASKLN